MTSITSPNSLSPAMLSSSSRRLNTTDQMQSARNCHASDSNRRASFLVEYRSSSEMLLAVSGVFRNVKTPENGKVIESKKFKSGHYLKCFKLPEIGLVF